MSVLTVGSGQQYATLASAVAASHDGDTIYVAAGTYLNDFAVINTKVSIIAVGGMANFVFDGSVPILNQKAIFVTRTDITLDHIEFSGAAVPDGNGAGIRYEGGKLTINNCYFHNNENGILAAAVAGGTITIDHTEFAANGKGDGYTHNVYVGQIGTLTISNSYIHDAVVGHEIKSRADNTIILNNRIVDGNGTASYSIDLPNGGAVTIQNNLIQQGPNSQNARIISYAAETATPYANSSLLISGNTIINQKISPSVLGLFNNTAIVAQLTGNHFFGLTTTQIAAGPNSQSGTDMLSTLPAIDTSHPWTPSPWDNLLSGGAGNDMIAGSSGRDLIVGGGGNDTFTVANGGGSDSIADFSAGAGAGDVVKLSGSGFASFAALQAAMTQSGADTVLSLGNGTTLTFLGLAPTAFSADDFNFTSVATPTPTVVQPFTLSVSAATTKTITGNSRANLLNGTTGNDRIDGRGGSDTMQGAAGDDTYVVDRSSDKVVEGDDQGIDTVISSAASFTLAANVENLTLSGSRAHTAYGNGLNNVITASARNDTIDAGAGNDILKAGIGACVLTGNTGNDMFVFSKLGAQSRVTDFHTGEDLLDLRPLMDTIGYAGTDPIADGTILLSADGNGGVIVSVDPPNSSVRGVVNLLGVSPDALTVGADILWA